jgi:hypothetical protein
MVEQAVQVVVVVVQARVEQQLHHQLKVTMVVTVEVQAQQAVVAEAVLEQLALVVAHKMAVQVVQVLHLA